MSTLSDKVESCKNGCKPSSTAMFDNTDSRIVLTLDYPDHAAAEQGLAALCEKARQIESEPCHIQHQFTDSGNSVRLALQIDFCCQAEATIFQLALRSLRV